MGAILDSAEDIRQNKKNPPRQAHKTEEKLEKDKNKGVKMIPAIAQRESGKPVNETYRFRNMEYGLTVTDITDERGRLEKQIVLVNGLVSEPLQAELREAIKRDSRYHNPQVVYPIR